MRILLMMLLAVGPCLAEESATGGEARPRGDDEWRRLQREEQLADPRADWRDQPWASDAWRLRPPRERGYARPGRSWRADRTVAAGPYIWPAGVRPRSFAPGERLGFGPADTPAMDWAALGLPRPAEGAVWVRVASDALEVRSDGVIGRIAYGLFR